MWTRAYRLAVSVAGLYLLLGVGVYALGMPSQPGPVVPLPGQATGGVLVALWVAAAAFAGLLWVLSDKARIPDRFAAIAPWLIPAVVGPIALYPLAAGHDHASIAGVAILWPAAVLPLGLAMASQARRWRAIFVVASFATAVVAATLGLAALRPYPIPLEIWVLRYLAVAGVVALPSAGLLRESFGPSTLSTPDTATSRVLAGAALIAACVAPAISGAFLLLPWDLALELAIAALVGGALTARVAVRPLAAVAARASTQRDLAVAVSEAERSRLAADLHDGPLQNILLLARRLETDGDAESAALAREIGSDLRELSGDLRLPMLDDLGVGAALEWLIGRARRLSGLDISLRYETDGRPPPDVELATFRISQEAIANAVRHGRPPIIVRCRTSGTALTLMVEDAGTDGSMNRPAIQRPTGQFGLLNMQQRAEQVGARLEFRRARAGGTTVAVEWRAGPVTP